jgi:hypothetical protein
MFNAFNRRNVSSDAFSMIKATAEHFGTTPDDLVSARRTRPLTRRPAGIEPATFSLEGCRFIQ